MTALDIQDLAGQLADALRAAGFEFERASLGAVWLRLGSSGGGRYEMFERNVLGWGLAPVVSITFQREQSGALCFGWVVHVGTADQSGNVRAVEAPAISRLVMMKDADVHSWNSA